MPDPTNPTDSSKVKVSLTSIDIPFLDLLLFLIKLAVAAVPAIIILDILLDYTNYLLGRIPALRPPETGKISETFLIILGLVGTIIFFAYRKSKTSPTVP